MKIVPTDGRVVVRRVAPANKTDGGILLPDTAKEKPTRGIVVALPKPAGRWQAGKFIESRLCVDDLVLFSAHAGNEVELDGKTLLVMDETEILGVIEG
jgi:chaperonin GroES